jgi:hypothetical protein
VATPNVTINESTSRQDAALTQTDAALTFQGNTVGEPAVTLPGIVKEVADNIDASQSEQVAAVSQCMDQPMMSIESEPTTDEKQSGSVASTVNVNQVTHTSSSVPNFPLHVERSQLVHENPTKAIEFSQPDGDIPIPLASAMNPKANLTNIRFGLKWEENDAEKLISL